MTINTIIAAVINRIRTATINTTIIAIVNKIIKVPINTVLDAWYDAAECYEEQKYCRSKCGFPKCSQRDVTKLCSFLNVDKKDV